MLFSYNWLQEFFKTKLPATEKLANLLTMHAFEVDGIEQKGKDWILDVAILPERGDCMGHEGLAREIAAITKQKLQTPPRARAYAQKSFLPQLKVSIRASRFVPRYSAFVIEGVKIAPSPQWMQDRLAMLGVNSINNIVDITNFVMLELGQPLHAFDFDKIKGSKMTIRETKKNEEIALLDEAELSLPAGVLVIEDGQGLIDLAGIRGGKTSSIGGKTQNIVLQAAVFDRTKIYQTKKQLSYSTTAAEIYCRGVDSGGVMKALERAAFLLEKFGGGRVVQTLDTYVGKRRYGTVPPKEIVLPKDLGEKLLGMKIPDTAVKAILSRLGFGVKGLRIIVPSWRPDISLPQDIVEEVGRVYGYENIEPASPSAAVLAPEQNPNLFWQEQVQNLLKESGFTEAYTYSLVGRKDLSLLGYAKEDKEKLVELENPISEDFAYLRLNLADNLLHTVVSNEKQWQNKGVKVFEIGKAFEKSKSGVQEHLMLGAMCSPADFYFLKGLLGVLFEQLGIAGVWYDDFEARPDEGRVGIWHPKKSAEVKIGGKEVGFLGEVSPSITSNIQTQRSIAAFELDLEKVFQLALEEREYRPPSRFPAVLRDIAVLIPQEVKVEDVLNIMETVGGKLVADIDLFDMYEGPELPEGKKNLAFHIVYQSEERTLTNREVGEAHNNIIKALEANEEWQVRT
ncbi:MAG: phenylalanine--tRNA ligase subunit beta [Candidatus Wildermuthbacteria bacterium]|nr:phenylalanine--tRNA ligase subunit beta [Candidatus Wildermuthbacteria bacterium]